jgi:II/X family phage/plasmid replication protein
MIDWVTAMLPCVHVPIDGGAVFKLAPGGEMVWLTQCGFMVEGSHDANIRVRSIGGDGQGRATQLLLDGNPSKFLQGHNLFGSDNLLDLVLDVFKRVAQAHQLTPTETEWQAIEQGDYRLSRIDYNLSFELPSRSDVKAWLRAAEFKSKSRHGRPSSKGGTLYYGKNSRRWSIKCYSKGEEIEAPKHRIPYALPVADLARWADNKLRIELTLRTKELTELNLHYARSLRPETLRALYFDYLRSLDMNEQLSLSTEELHSLPQRLRSTYILWNAGEDLRDTLPKATFYRHRRELNELGIDINLRKDVIDRSNVVPLVRVLEASPVGIPFWAFNDNLVHFSARKSA